MPVKIPVVQTGLEASIEAAAKKAGRNLKINMGGNAKSIEVREITNIVRNDVGCAASQSAFKN